MDKPQIICYSQKSVNFSLFDGRWIPSSAKFVLLGSSPRGTGILQIYEVCEGEAKLLKETEKGKPFKCGTFGASGLKTRHFATGDFDGRLQLWDLEDSTVPVYSVKAHKEIINCIDGIGGLTVGCGAPEIVTGSRDGSVKVWDPRQKQKPVITIEPLDGEDHRDCWAVAFGNSYNPDQRVVCAGYDNGDIKMFDLRTLKLMWEHNTSNGVCCLEFDRRDILMNKLVATTLESRFHVFDIRTYHSKKGYACLTEKVHKATIWVVRHLPQNRDIFITCGGAGSVYLWQYKYPTRRFEKDTDGEEYGVIGSLNLIQNCTLSTQPISSLDWSPDKTGLALCTSFDQTFRVVIVTKLNTL